VEPSAMKSGTDPHFFPTTGNPNRKSLSNNMAKSGLAHATSEPA